jgi:hypothetical protein
MKKYLSYSAIIFVLFLTGCGAKPYVDVTTKDFATLQLVPKSETLLFTDDYYAFFYQHTKGCKNDIPLGVLTTDSDTPSRIIKIPVNKPLQVNVNYRIESGNSVYTEYANFILVPEKNRHYIFEYARKDRGLFERALSEFDAYIMDDGKMIRIDPSRIRNFDPSKECEDD